MFIYFLTKHNTIVFLASAKTDISCKIKSLWGNFKTLWARKRLGTPCFIQTQI